MIIKKNSPICTVIAVLAAVSLLLCGGIPAFADGTETPFVPLGSDVKISGVSLVLGGEIGLVYHVYVSGDYSDGYMILGVKNREPIRVNISACPLDGDLRRKATCPLNAISLSEQVTVGVYDRGGKLLAARETSAEEYILELLDGNRATEKEKKIARSLLNYGHYAQRACSAANGWVIGEDYAETRALSAPTVDGSVFEPYGFRWENYSAACADITFALRLNYRTGILVFSPFEEKPTVSVNGTAVEVQAAERGGAHYAVEIDGVNALHLADECTVTVNGASVTFCALSYCRNIVRRNADPDTVNAVKALYEFYLATAS